MQFNYVTYQFSRALGNRPKLLRKFAFTSHYLILTTNDPSPLHPKKFTVWCGIWYGPITVNFDRYSSMLADYVFPEFDDIDADDRRKSRQDRAPPHIKRENMALLSDKFGESLISRNGPIDCPPRSWF